MDENISAYRRIIPPHLYTCWHTKDLPPFMKQNYDWMVRHNPEMTFHLYDESECREFIRSNFATSVVDAYDSLVPSAYKSDLWRYCILYIKGGVYLDIKYRCVPTFRLVELTEKEHYVRDLTEGCVYNALIVTRPRNETMKRCIEHIVLFT
jgi:mannosyltransferase OCH1-like enzyme